MQMKRRLQLILPAAATLFAGLAGAQVAGSGNGGGALSCTASTPLISTARVESISEIIGDDVITCSGGQPLAAGSPIPTVRITMSLGVSVTSRILVGPDISEAMLLIDEPGAAMAAPVPGYGPAAAQNACNNFALGAGPGGCVQYAFTTTDGVPIASSSPNSLTRPANVFFGAVRQNQVIFTGIPILPPVTAGISRVLRITNVRANIAGLGGGGLAGNTQVLSSVVADPFTALPIINPVQIGAFYLSGVDIAVRNADDTGGLDINGGAILGQLGQTPTAVALLKFSERFAGAFKTRVAATRDYNGQAAPNIVIQNVPGTAYNSESGLVFTGLGSFNGRHPGLADYGTRLKAVFNNIPPGVRLFVPVTNLAANGPLRGRLAAPATSTSDSYAVLVTGETDPDGNGSVSAVSPTISMNAAAPSLAEIPIVNGTATAVWEVVNTRSQGIETFSFGVWASSSFTGPAALGTGPVRMAFAPTPTTAFDIADGMQASASLPLPRFADTSVARPILTVGSSACLYSSASDFPSTIGAAGGTGTLAVTTGAGCSWWAASNATWLHITSGSNGTGPGAIGFSVDENTSSGGRNGVISVASQSYLYVAQTGTGAPIITPRGIVDPWNYTQGLAAGAWVSIYGFNLATVTQDWQPQPGAILPTSLGGITVSIDGIAAPLQHVSPTLINALVPAGVHQGQVEVIVSNSNLSSDPIGVTSSRYLPAIYSLPAPSYPRYYVTAVDPSTGQYLGNVTVDRRVARAVKPGDTIDLYAIGLGPTTPTFPTDIFFSDSYAVSSTFQVVLGPSRIAPVFAQLIGPGLYQVRITVPLDMPAGDQPIWIDLGTVESAQGVYLTVQP